MCGAWEKGWGALVLPGFGLFHSIQLMYVLVQTLRARRLSADLQIIRRIVLLTTCKLCCCTRHAAANDYAADHRHWLQEVCELRRSGGAMVYKPTQLDVTCTFCGAAA